MTYIETIKEGIHSVNRNWQLILIQFASTFLGFLSFFIIVGVPIAVAFILFGLDLTEILKMQDTFEVLRDSAALLQKYFTAALIILFSLVLYLSFIVTLWTFTISGIIGVFADTILNKDHRFTLRLFLQEGRTNFLPILLFSSLIGAGFIVIAFALGALGGAASSIIDTAKSREIAFALFLGVFFSLVLVTASLFIILGTLSVTVYGIAYLAFNKASSMETLKKTLRYLYSNPSAVGFYALLMFAYGLALFIVILIGAPLTLIPLIGPVLSVPYQLIVYFVQSYIGMVLISSTFIYYYKTAVSTSGNEISASSEPVTSATLTKDEFRDPEA